MTATKTTKPAAKPAPLATSAETDMFPEFTGQMEMLLDPMRRFDVKVFVDTESGILNADPDRVGPRVDPRTGLGIATAESLKRVIRDTAAHAMNTGYPFRPLPGVDYEYHTYMATGAILNAINQEVYQACGIRGYEPSEVGLPDDLAEKLTAGGQPVELPNPAYAIGTAGDKWLLKFDGSLDAEERMAAKAAFAEIAPGLGKLVDKLHKTSKIKVQGDDTMLKLNNELCRRYFDVRTFGAVGSTGDSVGHVRGPWQVVPGKTVEPIYVTEQSITRGAVTRIEDKYRKRQDMGRKYPTPYAMYEFKMFYLPTSAQKIGAHGYTSEDLRLFFTAMYSFGRLTPSSMRGHTEVAAVYVFAHDHPFGNAHAHKLFDRVGVERKPGVEEGTKFADYQFRVDAHDLPKGVTLIPLYVRS